MVKDIYESLFWASVQLQMSKSSVYNKNCFPHNFHNCFSGLKEFLCCRIMINFPSFKELLKYE
jgi:hypothetical protein